MLSRFKNDKRHKIGKRKKEMCDDKYSPRSYCIGATVRNSEEIIREHIICITSTIKYTYLAQKIVMKY